MNEDTKLTSRNCWCLCLTLSRGFPVDASVLRSGKACEMVQRWRMKKTDKNTAGIPLESHWITCTDSCSGTNPISWEIGHLERGNNDSREDVKKRKME